MPTHHKTLPQETNPAIWSPADIGADPIPFVRLASHTVRLPSGHRAGVTVGGTGVPLVLTHGFSVASGLYVQPLSRLASMGFMVVAVDMAGHGTSAELTGRGHVIDEYRQFLADVLDELGIRRSVLVGHSLGGRLTAELAAAEPDRALAVVLVDAAVGSAWDDLAAFSRYSPPMLGLVGATLAGDFTRILFWGGEQSSKLRALALPQAVANFVAPWRLVPPALSVLLAPPSTPTLRRLQARGVPTFVIHGDRDPLVPLAAARHAAAAAGAELIVVHGASHSWPLEDPESFRGLFSDLLDGDLGSTLAAATTGGLDTMFAPDALVHRLAPVEADDEPREESTPRYRWTREPPRAGPAVVTARRRR
jgi:pimeloyl-ACP methyl ester carboxylesterase